MDARGNKLTSCKIPDQYLKKQKSYLTFRTLDTQDEKEKRKKQRFQKSCYHNSKNIDNKTFAEDNNIKKKGSVAPEDILHMLNPNQSQITVINRF